MPDPLTLLGFAFVLGALIFIHESGHYFVAKSLGIKVETFSLGFGPKLLKLNRGGTEYCISAIPLGGYVKMLGENPDESLRGSREEFLSRSKFERFLVLVMGASLNIVLAVVLIAGIYMYGKPEPLYLSQAPVIGVIDPNAAAAEAGLRVEDEILEVGGTPVPTWNDLLLAVALSPNTTVDFTIRRDGQTLTVPVSVRATERERIGIVGVGPHNPILISSVEKGSAAEEAGLKPGDQVVGVGDTSVDGPAGADTFVQIVSASAGRPLDFHVMRDGERIRLSVTPREVTQRGETRGWVGVALSGRIGLRQYGPIEAFRESLIYNWEQTGVLFLTLKKLFTFQLSPRTLSGPIDIYRLTGESMRGGGIFYLTFMAMVSLQLGIINLLPIPILDGGHIFILLIEGTIRRELSMKIKERVMQFGFVLLLLIMGTVLFFDVDKNFPALRNLLGQ